MLGDDLGFERAGRVTGDFDGQLAKVALECLFAASVAGVTGLVGHQFILAVAQVVRQLSLLCAFYQRFGERHTVKNTALLLRSLTG